MKQGKGLELDRVIFIGRTMAEYARFFNLDLQGLRGKRVLDCPGGASSFRAEAVAQGIDAVACDIMYGPAADELHERGLADIDYVFEKFDGAGDMFIWKHYADKSELIKTRKRALSGFAKDYAGKGGYVHGRLPRLPFIDNEFDIALSANLMFMYSDKLDFDFHVESIRELLRVAKEVRIFPLVMLNGAPYEKIEEIVEIFNVGGLQAKIESVPYEFQRGANRMLKISRPAW